MAKSPLAANMLAYMRSLQISEAVMSGLATLDAEKSIPIEVLTKGVRGQTSHAKPKEGDFKPGKSSPHMVDYAMLPDGCEWVEIRVSLQVLPHALTPSATDTPEAAKELEKLVANYAIAGGFKELAELYVGNLANGRFAWRNRFMTDEARVEVKWSGGKLVFDPLKFDLKTPTTRQQMSGVECLIEGDATALDKLIEEFALGLSADAKTFEVRWLSKLPEHGEVFPSQEYDRSDSKSDVSRVYASIPHHHGGRLIRWAVMHSQKIGAAIRCIDHWHGNSDYDLPVPVNPYAGVQEAGIVLRYGKSEAPSFYDLKRKPDGMIKDLERGTPSDDAHFFVANLVRGGVYGDKE